MRYLGGAALELYQENPRKFYWETWALDPSLSKFKAEQKRPMLLSLYA